MPTRLEVLAILAGIARVRDGLVPLAEALAAGVPARTLQRMAARGELERVHDGVYRFPAVAWTWRSRLRAALLASRGTACASHTAAASLLGIEGVAIGRPEITVDYSAPLCLDGVRVHRSRALPDEDLTEVDGMRCTTGSRTVVDLAGRLGRLRRIEVVDAAIAAGAASRGGLYRRAVALRPGRTGVGSIIEVTRPGADGTFRSALERAFAEGVRAHGLPVPAYNVGLRHRGRLYVPDALWQPGDLVGELHGLRFHDAPADRGRDDERLTAYAELGLRTVVFTWHQVLGDFDAVAATIRAALARRVA